MRRYYAVPDLCLIIKLFISPPEIVDLVAVEEQSFPNFTPRPSHHVHLPHIHPTVNNHLTQRQGHGSLQQGTYSHNNICAQNKQSLNYNCYYE
jgi:hypothetical protein